MADERQVFAQNLTRLLREAQLSRRQVADRIGVSYKTLFRWTNHGIKRPTKATKDALERLCDLFHVRLRDLWAEQPPSVEDQCAERVREMMRIWERVGVDASGTVAWINSWHTAAHAVDRLRRDEPELWMTLRRFRELPSDAALMTHLETDVRGKMAAGGILAYERLLERERKYVFEEMVRRLKSGHPAVWRRLLTEFLLEQFVIEMLHQAVSDHGVEGAFQRVIDKWHGPSSDGGS